MAKVKVAARLRPFLKTENPDDAVVISPTEGSISVAHPRSTNERFKFSFTSCYDQSATQEEIFEQDVEPLVEHVFHGLICTVFAYGVTSSGKTHTIQGTPAEPGIIPRVVKALAARRNQFPEGYVSLSVSYMEIYKDEAYDLFVTRENAPKLPIREDPSGKIVVANLSERPINTFSEFEGMFSLACKSRSTGATNLNHASSRSHAVLSITVTILEPTGQRVLTGKINLVDLAGSENNKLTGNDPSRMAESSAINKSLTVLGQVVHALNTGATRIPYRDSKLTRILQDALGGSSIGLLICNLAPGIKFRQDTLNTLNFASRTKQIENKPTVNERDTRPPPKIHFSHTQAPAPALRPPLIPRAITGHSRMSTGGVNYQSLVFPTVGGFGFNPASRNSIGGMERIGEGSTKPVLQQVQIDIDEKISRAVQQEVERRLAERETQERERFEEFERRERERAADRERLEMEQRELLMKKHDDLNKLLKRTLRKAEKENQKTEGGGDVEQKILSPKKSKKLAMAYVSLGRDYLQSKEPDYNAALKLWQQAETYVPENKALKKRITELQVAIREGVSYRLGKRSRSSYTVDSPGSGSPSGSRDHKESSRLRRKARLALAKERGELDLKTPSPKKSRSKKNNDVFVQDSDDELLVSEGG